MGHNKDYMLRAWLLLVLVSAGLIVAYYLPPQIGSWQLTPIDLLADLRMQPALDAEDLTGISETLPVDSTKAGADSTTTVNTSAREAKRIEQFRTSADSSFVVIEDYHPERKALSDLYNSISDRAELGRPVRIAFCGDSFVEGDIFTDALRRGLQQRWGGVGVGWMGMTSPTAGFRQSIRHSSKGWEELNLIHNSKHRTPITGYAYRGNSGDWSEYQAISGQTLPDAQFFYSAEQAAQIRVELSDTTYTQSLEPDGPKQMQCLSINSKGSSRLRLSLIEGNITSYGISLESTSGIIVDNISMRGNSGLLALSTDTELTKAWRQYHDYDLIVLQYGLNVASNKQRNYQGYASKMQQVITYLKGVYPHSSILLLGVSDRAQRSAQGLQTMLGVEYLHKTQRQIAHDNGIAFWSTLEAMRRLGGIVYMSEHGMAAKDYTHITHKGGQLLAPKLIEAFITEANEYD